MARPSSVDMNHMRYRVKLFPEITIKSRPVRKEMVRCLRTNLRNMWSRMPMTRADVQLLHGALRQLVRGRGG